MREEEYTETKKRFISEDGQIFATENDCLLHERKQKLTAVFVAVHEDYPEDSVVFSTDVEANNFAENEFRINDSSYTVVELYVDIELKKD